MRYRRIFSLLLITILIVSSCNRGYKRLSPKEMQDILIDMSLTEAYFQNHYTPDSIRAQAYSSICKRHGVTMQDWDSSIVVYSGKYIETYKIIYQNAMDSVVRLQKNLQRKQEVIDSISDRLNRIRNADIDSVNLITDIQTYNRCDFVIRSFELKPLMPYSSIFSVKLSSSFANLPFPIDTVIMLRLQLNFTDSTDTVITKPILHNGIDSIRVNIPQDKLMNGAKGDVFTNDIVQGALVRTRKLSFVRLDKMPDNTDE